MDTNNQKLQDFQLYLKHMPKSDMYAFFAVFAGIALIITALISL